MEGPLDPCGALDPWWITESVSLFRSSHCDAKLCRSMVFPANELVSHSDEHTGIQCLLPTPASWTMPWAALNHGLTEYVCMLLVNSFSNWIIVLLSLWKYVCVLLVPSHNFSPSKSLSKWPVCLWNYSAGYQLKTVCTQILFLQIFERGWNSGYICTQRSVHKGLCSTLLMFPPMMCNNHISFCGIFCARITREKLPCQVFGIQAAQSMRISCGMYFRVQVILEPSLISQTYKLLNNNVLRAC